MTFAQLRACFIHDAVFYATVIYKNSRALMVSEGCFLASTKLKGLKSPPPRCEADFETAASYGHVNIAATSANYTCSVLVKIPHSSQSITIKRVFSRVCTLDVPGYVLWTCAPGYAPGRVKPT